MENCSSVTTIKRSKVHENLKQKETKKKKSKNGKVDAFYSTQKNIHKNSNHIDFVNTYVKEGKSKAEIVLKYNKKKENRKNFKGVKGLPAKKNFNHAINRKATLERLRDGQRLADGSTGEGGLTRQLKKKNKMSEDTYVESKSSLANVVKKKRTSLITKKWRREVKQQIQNENLFKRSKEKKLDFSISESPMQSKKNIRGDQILSSSVTRLRNEIIQDDSEDEEYTVSKRESDNSLIHSKGDVKLDSHSYDSNPLQKIIEQRMLESSTDSEESEEDLDDDYDIGIDDIDLGQDESDEIHTATEDEESNILSESLDSRVDDSANYHKKKLKEALSRGRDISPFDDIIERGMKSYINHGSRKKGKFMQRSDRPSSRTKGKLPKNYNLR